MNQSCASNCTRNPITTRIATNKDIMHEILSMASKARNTLDITVQHPCAESAAINCMSDLVDAQTELLREIRVTLGEIIEILG
jgi:glycine betaine/choline ABC-type transport system substrate-binding protein